MPRAFEWHFCRVTSVRAETPRVKSVRLVTPWLARFRPGQHVDVRLTAPDGYQAQRSYSIASAPEEPCEIELGVELLEDGEVSPFFHEVVQAGDELELRGPIGGPFTWTVRDGGPLLLIGGGSGVVPLMSMLRHRIANGDRTPTMLLYSSRSLGDVVYREELERISGSDPAMHLAITLTRGAPDGWNGLTGRVNPGMISEALEASGVPAHVYVCGSNGFVEAASAALQDAGVDASTIATERFGPTGTV